MKGLKKLLFWLIPYQQVTLFVPLATQEVSSMLKMALITEWELEVQSLWGKPIQYRYKVDIKNEFIKIAGPIGARISPLLTQGKIQLNPSNSKTILQLTIRPANASIIQMVIGLGTFFGVMVFVLVSNGMLSLLMLLLVVMIPLIYGIQLYNFRYKVKLILQLLKQTLKL